MLNNIREEHYFIQLSTRKCLTISDLLSAQPPPPSPNNISLLIISVGLQEPNMITSKFEIPRHALFSGPILTKVHTSISQIGHEYEYEVHNHPLIIFSQSGSRSALRHISTYDVGLHEQSKPKHWPDVLSMVRRYSANVCKIVCQWMLPHNWHASFQNLLSATVTSDPINCLPIILGHRGRIHLLGSTDDLPICDLSISCSIT